MALVFITVYACILMLAHLIDWGTDSKYVDQNMHLHCKHLPTFTERLVNINQETSLSVDNLCN